MSQGPRKLGRGKAVGVGAATISVGTASGEGGIRAQRQGRCRGNAGVTGESGPSGRREQPVAGIRDESTQGLAATVNTLVLLRVTWGSRLHAKETLDETCFFPGSHWPRCVARLRGSRELGGQ